jgi:hypothetical protein
MAKKFFVVGYLVLVVGGAFLPLITNAINMPPIWPTGYWGPFVGCNGIDCNAQGFCGIVQVFLNIISFGISLAFFVLMPIFLTWGGVVILMSQGNPGKMSEGKKILTGTLVGALIALGGYLILQTLGSFLNLNFLDISALRC